MNAATTDDTTGGRLSRDTLAAVLVAVCARTSLDPADARLIKFTNNAVFRLTRTPAVVRIAGSATARRRTRKVVQVATWLAEHDAPAVRLLPGVEQPVMVDGQLATVWQSVPAAGPQPGGTDLARVLLRLHTLPAPSFALPAWRPLTAIRERLAEPEAVSHDTIEFLLNRCDEVEIQLSTVRFVLRRDQSTATRRWPT